MRSEAEFFYGSVKWANQALAVAIREVYDRGEIGSRRLVISYVLKEFINYGYWWQAATLRAHIHRAMKSKRFSFTASAAAEADPLKVGGGAV